MGLGKSIQTLGLILSNMPPPSSSSGRGGEPCRCTLIVCPVSIIASWNMQIAAFVKPGYLNVEIYQGPKRAQIVRKIKSKNSVDILLTSYETLIGDFRQRQEMEDEKAEAKAEKAAERTKNKKKSKKGRRTEAWTDKGNDSDDDFDPDLSEDDDDDDHHLPASVTRKRKTAGTKKGPWILDVRLWRICLDEAHKIRNRDTTFFKCTSSMAAKHKLCLTATPFVNKVADIYALVSFLASGNEGMERSNPFVDPKAFKKFVGEPIAEAKEIGLARVRTLMGHIALRRQKNLVGDLGIPTKTIEICSLSSPKRAGIAKFMILCILWHVNFSFK